MVSTVLYGGLWRLYGDRWLRLRSLVVGDYSGGVNIDGKGWWFGSSEWVESSRIWVIRGHSAGGLKARLAGVW